MKPSQRAALFALVMCLALVVLPFTAWAYGPVEGSEGRLYFDYNDTNTYPNYPAFNSFKDNPKRDFEPAFMNIKKTTDTVWETKDTIILEKGVTYDVFVFYHNNAPLGTNTAINTRVLIDFPPLVRAGFSVQGTATISADNSTPKSIWSSLLFSAANDTILSYKTGSAYVKYNDGTTKSLPDDGNNLFTSSGQLVGMNLDGKVPGCNENAGFVMFQIVADQPDFTISNQVRINNDGNVVGDWIESVKAKKGDIIDFFIEYKNTGTITQNNVVIKDVLPVGLEYIGNSSVLYNAAHPSSSGGVRVVDGIVSDTGINIGNYTAGSNAFIKFSARVTSGDSTTVQSVAYAITENGSKSDVASVDLDSD